ncbi:MAG: stage 0 sporulation family protein [Nitrospinota bacterium]
MLGVKEEDKKEKKHENREREKRVQYIIKARLRGNGRVQKYNPGSLNIKVGDVCIVETKRGLEFAVATMTKVMDSGKKKRGKFRYIVRKADSSDMDRLKSNESSEKEAMTFCQERIRERELAMKLARVEFDFMAEKATFYFSAEGRVDFRDLVKDISHKLKMKVEMWQIGVRDEARISGGCGTCGKPLCCSTFLRDFEPVSIRMAKDQSLALNPMKISGTCGRLMCCLGYEHKTYCQMKKGLPRVGRMVTTAEGKGKITQINVLNRVK